MRLFIVIIVSVVRVCECFTMLIEWRSIVLACYYLGLRSNKWNEGWSSPRDLEMLVERGRLKGIGQKRARRYELS